MRILVRERWQIGTGVLKSKRFDRRDAWPRSKCTRMDLNHLSVLIRAIVSLLKSAIRKLPLQRKTVWFRTLLLQSVQQSGTKDLERSTRRGFRHIGKSHLSVTRMLQELTRMKLKTVVLENECIALFTVLGGAADDGGGGNTAPLALICAFATSQGKSKRIFALGVC